MPTICDKRLKLDVPCTSRSQEIPPKAIGGGIFATFLRHNFRQEIDSDVISGADVDPVGMDPHVKFGDSMSNRFRDIQLPNFVTNDDDASLCRSSHKGKTPLGVLPKN